MPATRFPPATRFLPAVRFLPATRFLRSAPLGLRAGALALVLAAAAMVAALAAPVRAATTPPLDQAMAAVFTVHTADAADRFLGSAFLWGDGAVAVTNAHVVGTLGQVRLKDAQGAEQIATVIAADASRDVAVISVTPGRKGLIPSPEAPRLGAEVWALGAPLGIEFSVTEGRISALSRQVDAAVPIAMLQHDAAVNPGSSGGPLIDAAGGLLGMNAQIADGSRMFVGIAYAIPAADLARIVAGLIDETLPPLPRLGLTARAVDRELAAALGIAATGLLVDAVEPAGLADRAGLRPGDVILAVGGTALAGPGDLAYALETASAVADADEGTGSLDVTLLRDGAVLVLMTDLDAQTPGLGLRDLSSAPARVASYTLPGLGIDLDDGGTLREVSANSPAAFAGLEAGERVLAVNGHDLAGLDRATGYEAAVLVLVCGKNGATRHVLIDPWATAKTIRPVGGANVLDRDVVLF